MLHSDTITVFNRYVAGDSTTWYPHVIRGVQLITDRSSLMAKYGAETSDNAFISIPISKEENTIKVGYLPYYPPKMWARQVNEDLPGTITFNDNAIDFDFVIAGEYEEDPINDESYNSYDGLYNYMNAKEDYCYRITSVNGPYKLIPHIEILAR